MIGCSLEGTNISLSYTTGSVCYLSSFYLSSGVENNEIFCLCSLIRVSFRLSWSGNKKVTVSYSTTSCMNFSPTIRSFATHLHLKCAVPIFTLYIVVGSTMYPVVG